jgi:hypothetical protein
MLGGKFMRRHAWGLVLFLMSSTAFAEETGGHSGGGRLGQVSSGLGGATGGSDGGSRSGGDSERQRTGNDSVRDPVIRRDVVYIENGSGAVAAIQTKKKSRYDGGTARLEAYVGAQKVYESEGSWTAELAIRDGLFRLGGQFTRYYETQPDGSNLTLSVPSLIGGVRVDDRGPTAVYLEGGLVGAKTKGDPDMDTSVAGALAGVRFEHHVTNRASVTAEVHEMFFEDDVRAHSARVGLKVGIAQASFRILDLNVGPALYGPEFGLRF